MEWSIISNFIKPELLAVVAVCWVIGFVLKQTPKVPNWSIVYVVTVVAVVLANLMLGFGADATIQGVLAGAFSVYGYQLVKQATNIKS